MTPMTSRSFGPLHWLVLLVALVWAGDAKAENRRMAVMDFTQGAGSQEYAGLGMALSGMLVGDLLQVEQLTLVERQRLSDLVSELKLSEGEFIDPKTAQKLGKGLGADLMLMGSYSVVGDAFVLDGRIVDVASGEIRGAGNSSGATAEFVAVGKDLVGQLVEALNIELGAGEKRKMMLHAETESFQALSAYGEGLQRKKEGNTTDAQAAFQRATQIDPGFAAAKSALARMRTELKGHEAAFQDWKSKLKADAHREVLSAFPDESTRGANYADDLQSLAGLTLRLLALEQAGLHCQRSKEMAAFLDRKDWTFSKGLVDADAVRATTLQNAKEMVRAQEEYQRKLVEPMYSKFPKSKAEKMKQFESALLATREARIDGAMKTLSAARIPEWTQIVNATQTLEQTAALEAYEQSLNPAAASYANPAIKHLLVHNKTATLWKSLSAWTQSYKTSLRQCHADSEYLAKLDEIALRIKHTDLSRQNVTVHPGGIGPMVFVPFGLSLEMEASLLYSEVYGATPALKGRMDALLADHPIGTRLHQMVLEHVKRITALAQKQQTVAQFTHGLPQAQAKALLFALSETDSPAIRRDSPMCKQHAQMLKTMGRSLKSAEKSSANLPVALRGKNLKVILDLAMPMLAVAKDMGCLTEHDSRFQDQAAVRAYVERLMSDTATPADAPAICDSMSIGLDAIKDYDLEQSVLLSAALTTLYSQAHQGCIEL